MSRNTEEKYKRARKRVNRIKRFYSHVTTMLIVSVFLMILFMILRLPPMIILIVMGSWGVALGMEAVDLFGLPGMSRDWEQNMIEKEMRRMESEDQLHDQNPPVKRIESVREPMTNEDELDLDELELRELQKRRSDWNDSDFV